VCPDVTPCVAVWGGGRKEGGGGRGDGGGRRGEGEIEQMFLTCQKVQPQNFEEKTSDIHKQDPGKTKTNP